MRLGLGREDCGAPACTTQGSRAPLLSRPAALWEQRRLLESEAWCLALALPRFRLRYFSQVIFLFEPHFSRL